MILLIYLFICQKITGFVAENRIVNYHWLNDFANIFIYLSKDHWFCSRKSNS